MARILLVDDERTILTVLSAVLTLEHYDVSVVDGGEQALELMKKETFDLMISDVRMRPMDGVQLLREARALYPDMAAILVSAYDMDSTKSEVLKMGATAFLKKPFHNNELLALVEEAVTNKPATEGKATDEGSG